MNDQTTILKALFFQKLIWLVPVVFLFHELEEWNILAWYDAYFVDVPESTDVSIRTWLVAVSIVGFLLTSLTLLFKSETVKAYFMVPLIIVTLGNGLQHLYWTFLFGDYAPGVIFGGLIGVPLGCYFLYRCVSGKLISRWYLLLFVPYIANSIVQTIAAGNTPPPYIRAVHELMIDILRSLS